METHIWPLLNLTICGELAKYVSWHMVQNSEFSLSKVSLSVVGNALGVGETKTLSDLQKSILSALTQLEIYINNLGHERPTISQIQSPINHFLQQLKKVNGLKNTGFHIILDEYENLLDYQQQIVNTMIKHSGDNCYFKIGVRELGWRVHTTLNDNESLISPADYELISIEERLKDNFAHFARSVCESRLKSNETSVGMYLSLDRLLPILSTTEEANLLGVGRRVDKIRQEINAPALQSGVETVDDFVLYVFYELNQRDVDATIRDIRAYLTGDKSTRDRYDNHAQALLFSLADKGASIGKHYCGHGTFARIAHGNIRFYMQLLHESIVQQICISKGPVAAY